MSNAIGEVETGLLARMRKPLNALDQEPRRIFGEQTQLVGAHELGHVQVDAGKKQ